MATHTSYCIGGYLDVCIFQPDLVNPYYKLTDPYMNLDILGPKIILPHWS
ncbi:hypothetical protein BDQ94DRAFT_166780 [Aspergillus welwitschiae]|uniref:Uncharacterized protein n=1 Tax=Aspergillus welwitschiae TaxID=1341132 RepID=A0A3F3QEF6_9EURO|nr:hypothetical protein BDQ94DRAFT_166780 [Aspergillus welwitschiae]RDH37613.1 hypothetical protein BDQ94DRAFT_166780 [Aspergillus welwitschiae]